MFLATFENLMMIEKQIKLYIKNKFGKENGKLSKMKFGLVGTSTSKHIL